MAANDGVTLLELTIALSIFAIVMGAAAQGLVASYSSLKVQEQRAEAAHLCRSVLDHMREFRDNNAATFPDSLTQHWPAGSPIEGITAAAETSLNEYELTVSYGDAGAAPLPVTVQVAWKDHQGRPISFSVTTLLSES
jgi:prepilin-type N-terminal cleavage/methylation domain-containing protein